VERRKPSSSHASWSGPVIDRAGSYAAGHSSYPSPHAWSSRVLAGVEQVEGREAAPAHPPVELEVESARHRGAAQRHVLVVGAEGRPPAVEEPGHRLGVLGGLVGPVVVELVVVPDHQPRRGGVRGLEVGVGLVLRVPLAVAGQPYRLGAAVVADVAGGGDVVVGLVLVLVVAEVQHQVGVVLGQAPVGGEEAVLELAAGHERHRQRRREAARPGSGEGAAGTGQVAAGAEPVVVLAAGAQAGDLDVDGVRAARVGARPAAGDHAPEPAVGRDLPAHGVAPARHPTASVVGERLGREAGPDDEAVGRGVAGRDAERERVAAQRGGGGTRALVGRGDEADGPGGAGERGPGEHGASRGGQAVGGGRVDGVGPREIHGLHPSGRGRREDGRDATCR
jgi:hypothetical protein